MPPNDPRFLSTSADERELYYLAWKHADAAAQGNQYYDSDVDEEDLLDGDMASMLANLPTLDQALPPEVRAALGLGGGPAPAPLPAPPRPGDGIPPVPLPFPASPPPLFPGEGGAGEPVDPAAIFGGRRPPP